MPTKKHARTQSTENNLPVPPTSPGKARKGNNQPVLGAKGPDTRAISTVENQSIQRDEVEVLQSIWMDDYEHVEKAGAWKTSNIAFNLHLKAKTDDVEEIGCVLSVTMTPTYPRTIPELRLNNYKGVRPHEKAKLAAVIEDMPPKLVGGVMIYDIATAVQDTLEDMVQMRKKSAGMPTFHDQRLKEEKLKKEQAKKEEQAKQMEKERADMEADRVMGAMIEKEKKKRKERAREVQGKKKPVNLDQKGNNSSHGDQTTFDREITVLSREGGAPLVFYQVCGMVKVAQGPLTAVHTVKPSLPNSEECGIALVLKCVEVEDAHSNCLEGKRQIQNLEGELDKIRKLRHPNIAELYEFKVVQTSTSNPTWKISILMEFADKGSLRDLLEVVGTVDVDIARSWTIQLLEALDHIHSKGIFHNALHVGNILLARSASGDTTYAKLGDICFPKLIADFKSYGKESIGTDSRSAFWSPPESIQPGAKANRKTDIWNLGVVFLQMVFGLKIAQRYDSPEALMQSTDLSSSLHDFLGSIFKADPKKRPSAFDLLPSEFLRNNDPVVIPPRAHSPASIRGSMSIAVPKHFRNRLGSNQALQSMSRYESDFREDGRLGKGGFGEVVKARNRLDGGVYAIKKITQTHGSSLTDILSEVMLLSRINHQYVVRYYTAWLEEDYSSIYQDEDDEDDSEAISYTDSTNHSAVIKSSTEEEFSYTGGGGLDFISSSGYPKIQFGYDSNDDSEEEEDEDEDSDSQSESESKSDSRANGKVVKKAIKKEKREERKGRVTLYIQMELCERQTLRDLLRQDLHLRLDEGWRLLRQILEGLAHIHGLGIIHRDLKPDNIFIDVGGNPRIGDFGLATSGYDRINILQSDNLDSEMTTDVGTALYVAPELRSHGQGKYNEKMYSLGIIFFEMCHPLKTAMERDQVIRQLRMKDFSLPPEFHNEKRAAQGAIITSLINHRPSDRPSSTELLQSGKLPIGVEDEKMRQALQSISDPNNPYHKKALRLLFSQSTLEYQDFMYDPKDNQLTTQDLLLQEQVKERLIAIFRRHGAVETNRHILLPSSKFYSGNVVHLLDSTGTKVQLPYDLTLPNARALAREEPASPKTFTFGNVFRENPAGGQPFQHGEVDFDIVSFNSLDLALKEAEVVKVIDEVVDAFPSLRTSQICYHISHASLLELIMEFCRIDTTHRATVKEVLSRLNIGQCNFTRIRNELRSSDMGISATSLDDLARFDWRSDQEKAFQRLRGIFDGTSILDKSASVLNHISNVIAYLKRFGVHRRIYINPLGTYNDKFYRGGLAFQCVYDTRRREVFAAGGRYDALIQDHRPRMRSKAQETHAVGFSLAWEKLFHSMARYQRNQSKTPQKKTEDPDATGDWITRRCDVLVASFDKTLLRTECVALLQELWANDIKAELACDASSPDKLVHLYRGDGFGWIVILKTPGAASHSTTSATSERQVKVKNLFRKEELEIKLHDLISYLKSEVAERDRRLFGSQHHSAAHERKVLRQPSDVINLGEEFFHDVRILEWEKKARKLNRRAVIENARTRVSNLVSTLQDGPIIAIDCGKDDILEALRTVSLKDSEGWKRVAQMAAAPQRRYIAQIQELLQEVSSEGRAFCFLFNLRTGVVVLYHFG